MVCYDLCCSIDVYDIRRCFTEGLRQINQDKKQRLGTGIEGTLVLFEYPHIIMYHLYFTFYFSLL